MSHNETEGNTKNARLSARALKERDDRIQCGKNRRSKLLQFLAGHRVGLGTTEDEELTILNDLIGDL